jgi:hypothetical protein
MISVITTSFNPETSAINSDAPSSIVTSGMCSGPVSDLQPASNSETGAREIDGEIIRRDVVKHHIALPVTALCTEYERDARKVPGLMDGLWDCQPLPDRHEGMARAFSDSQRQQADRRGLRQKATLSCSQSLLREDPAASVQHYMADGRHQQGVNHVGSDQVEIAERTVSA